MLLTLIVTMLAASSSAALTDQPFMFGRLAAGRFDPSGLTNRALLQSNKKMKVLSVPLFHEGRGEIGESLGDFHIKYS